MIVATEAQMIVEDKYKKRVLHRSLLRSDQREDDSQESQED